MKQRPGCLSIPPWALVSAPHWASRIVCRCERTDVVIALRRGGARKMELRARYYSTAIPHRVHRWGPVVLIRWTPKKNRTV